MSAVSLAEVKDFLNITTGTNDGELQAMLERAEAILAARIGPLEPVTVTDEVHTGPGPIVLKRFPVVSVSSATSSGVAVSDLDADTDAGVLYGTFGSTRRAVRVTYVAGWSSLPEDLVAAVLELVQHLWQSQRGSAPSAIALQQPDAVGDVQPGGSYLLPYRVQSLIEPYVVPSVA